MSSAERRSLVDRCPEFEVGESLYFNPLRSASDVDGFTLEGKADIAFPDGRMRLSSVVDPSEGQRANYVYWAPESFPPDVAVSWEFTPIREPGLAMLFFSAKGRAGGDIFDRSLEARSGVYGQYHHGDINAFHVSYFRRAVPLARSFHVSNLRKSYGFHLVAQGPDPIPDVDDVASPYKMTAIHCGPWIQFLINDLEIFTWKDGDERYGPPLSGGGRIGFRQMAPLTAEYANLRVSAVRAMEGH